MASLVSRKFYEYLFPTFMMTVAMSVSLLLNSIVVGNLLGGKALAAVNLNNPISNLASAVINIFAFGAVTTIAILKGALKNKKANKVFSMTISLGLVATTVMMLVCLFEMNNIAGMLCGWKSLELLNLTKEYLFPLVLGFPVVLFFAVISAIMRVEGFPKFTATILIISNLLNVVLGYIFIKYFNMGVAGSGWGMLAGFVLGNIMLSYYFFAKERTLKFCKYNFKDLKELLPKLVLTGLPNGATNIFTLLRIFTLNLFILGIFNTMGVAIYALCVNVVYFACIFVRGVANTLLTIIGVLFGEKDYSGIQKVLKTGLCVTLLSSIIFIIIFAFFPNFICNIYGLKSAEEITLTDKALKAFAFCVPFFGLNYLFMCYFQCIKREKFSFVISALDNFFIVAALVMVFSKIKAELLWWGYPAAEIIMLLIIASYCLYHSKKDNLSFPFLLPKKNNMVLNISLNNDLNEIMECSKQVIEFCLKNNLSEEKALKAGVIIEEVGTNVLEVSKSKKDFLDIKLTIEEDFVNIRFRDNELKFNPIEYLKDKNNEILYSGLELVKASVSEWNYARNIGFNTLIIRI